MDDLSSFPNLKLLKIETLIELRTLIDAELVQRRQQAIEDIRICNLLLNPRKRTSKGKKGKGETVLKQLLSSPRLNETGESLLDLDKSLPTPRSAEKEDDGIEDVFSRGARKEDLDRELDEISRNYQFYRKI